MSRKQKIEREVEETFRCFDQIERVKPSLWFSTRLESRIRSLGTRTERPVLPLFTIKVLKPAFLALIVVLNLVTIFMVLQQVSASVRSSELISSFASEYAYTSTDEIPSLDAM